MSKSSGLQVDFVKNDSVKTNWKAVYIAGIVSFLAAVENTVVGMAEWPYMHTIDSSATSSFFGIASSVSKWGHVIFSIIFSLWTYKTQTVRWQLIVGRVLAFVGCCIYLCVEFLPSGRRYLMLGCYFIFSVASSSSVILRVYLVLVSSDEDRPRAFATTALSGMTSIIIGPVIQLIFSSISYPGFELLPGLRFHLYSAPIWLATITNVFSIFFIYFALEEMPQKEKKSKKSDEFDYSIEAVKRRLNKIQALDVSWGLVILCLLEMLVTQLSPMTLGTVASPIFMATFGWNGEHTVRVTSITMGAVGILSILVAVLFMSTKFPTWVPSRVCFLIGMCISMFLYISTYPYPMTSHVLPKYNATARTGCNPDEYSWCSSEKGTWPVIFIPVIVAVMGLAMPMQGIGMDTIYSKIVSKADQSIMQALVVVAADIMQVLGPIYAALMFTNLGQGALWISNGVITFVGVIAWCFFFPRLSKY